MHQRKSTMIDLVQELESLNTGNRYDQLIENARNGRYHDYKNPPDVICGKVELVKDLHAFPELQELSKAVKDGAYDEEADELDKAMLRKDLPAYMWPALGL